jgi:hypothetical protein
MGGATAELRTIARLRKESRAGVLVGALADIRSPIGSRLRSFLLFHRALRLPSAHANVHLHDGQISLGQRWAPLSVAPLGSEIFTG